MRSSRRFITTWRQQWLRLISRNFPGTWSSYPHSSSHWKHTLWMSSGNTFISFSFLLQWHRKIPTITDTITLKPKTLIRWILALEEHEPPRWLWSPYACLGCCQDNISQLWVRTPVRGPLFTLFSGKKMCQLLKHWGWNSSKEMSSKGNGSRMDKTGIAMHWGLVMVKRKWTERGQ